MKGVKQKCEASTINKIPYSFFMQLDRLEIISLFDNINEITTATPFQQ